MEIVRGQHHLIEGQYMLLGSELFPKEIENLSDFSLDPYLSRWKAQSYAAKDFASFSDKHIKSLVLPYFIWQ